MFWEGDLLSNRFFPMARNMSNTMKLSYGPPHGMEAKQATITLRKAVGKVQERKKGRLRLTPKAQNVSA